VNAAPSASPKASAKVSKYNR